MIMIEIKGIRFDVEINRKRIRNMYMRLKDNRILVSAPLRMPEYEIYRFIDSKRDWIYKAYDQMVYKKRTTMMYHGTDVFYVFGKPYRLNISQGKKNVLIDSGEIFLVYKDNSEDAIRYLYKYMDKYLLRKANEYLEKHLVFLEDYGYDLVPQLKCRIMSSKWGVCYTRKNEISISSYLIHYPEECLEYIMVHEMTHFLIPNHSKRFYEIVKHNMPDYKNAADKLKQ